MVHSFKCACHAFAWGFLLTLSERVRTWLAILPNFTGSSGASWALQHLLALAQLPSYPGEEIKRRALQCRKYASAKGSRQKTIFKDLKGGCPDLQARIGTSSSHQGARKADPILRLLHQRAALLRQIHTR